MRGHHRERAQAIVLIALMMAVLSRPDARDTTSLPYQDIGWSLFAYTEGRLLAPAMTEPRPGLLPILWSGF